MPFIDLILQKGNRGKLSSMEVARAVSNGELPTLGEEYFRERDLDEAAAQAKIDSSSRLLQNFLLFLPRVLFNSILLVVAIVLQILWLTFLFGSVIGVVVLLIFLPGAFLLPLTLLVHLEPLWD